LSDFEKEHINSNCIASSLTYIETTPIVMTSKLTQPMSLPGPTQISVQNFTAVRCAVVEFIACTRYDASGLFSR